MSVSTEAARCQAAGCDNGDGAGNTSAENRLVTGEFIHRSVNSKVILRAGAIADLPAELSLLGCSRPALLYGPGVKDSEVGARVRAALSSFRVTLFDSIPAHSSTEVVQQIAREAAAANIDCIVAVGGGSASDSAKAVALLLAEGGTLAQHATQFIPPATVIIPELRKPKLPIVAIPTTASAAEVTPSFGIRQEAAAGATKLLFWDLRVASRLIVIDPEANVSVPGRVMLSTGMNGLAHCLEGLYSTTRTPMTTALAVEGTRLFLRALRDVAHDPMSIPFRADILTAAHLSGQVLMNARTGLHHAICHALGALTGAAHGAVNSVMLPHALAFNLPAADEPLGQAASALGMQGGSATMRARKLVDAVRELQQDIAVPSRLRDLGFDKALLLEVAGKVMGERGLAFNPRRVAGPQEIEALLEAAW